MVNNDAPGKSPLDGARIAELLQLRGGALLPKLAELYRSQSLETLQALRAAIGAANRGEVVSLSHAVKSSSINIGAVQVAQLAATMEQAARSGGALPQDAEWLELMRACEQAMGALANLPKGGQP